MKVLVCGGRKYTDFRKVCDTLDKLHAKNPISLIVEGGAKGADTMARSWGGFHRVPVRTFPADWDNHGLAAGPIRNGQMLDEGKPDLVVAFPTNGKLSESKDTANMVKQARAKKIKTIVITTEKRNGTAGDQGRTRRPGRRPY